MTEEFEVSQGKTIGDLGREALWFVGHSAFAILSMALVVAVMTAFHPDPDAPTPKYIATGLAFLVPMVVGLIIAKAKHNDIARYTWITGVLFFAAVCVWVLDLPTGPGLCEQCVPPNGLIQKLYRTFFDINHGSGLIGGWGLVVGTWVPLSLIGYSIGAKVGLDS